MVSLYSRQEGVFRKARRTQRMRADDVEVERTSTNIKTEPDSESDFPVLVLFPLRCQPYQCLHCLGNAALPSDQRLSNLGSKSSLQRHFDRWHQPFRPGGPSPFPDPGCT